MKRYITAKQSDIDSLKSHILWGDFIQGIAIILAIFFMLSSNGNAEEIDGRPDIRPIKNSDVVRIAGGYGEQRSAEGRIYFHTGIDFACYLDTNIYAAGSGEVIEARYINGYGNCVIIKHNWIKNGKAYSCYSVYAHLVEFKVLKGQMVDKRQVIGLAGMTGRAEGVHLHYELRDANNQPVWNGKYQAENIAENKMAARQ